MSSQTDNGKALDIWNDIAAFWDEGVGQDGNRYWTVLQRPCLERLIPTKPDTKALDVATGNGLVARWLANRGASVIATDGSEKMLEHAVARCSPEDLQRIAFQKLDVTREEDFEELLNTPAARERFDVVLTNMVLMDIPTLGPLAAALPKLLKEDGIFVAIMLHPVFITSGATRNVEIRSDAIGSETDISRTMVMRDYLDVPPYAGYALPNQPKSQIYFHRPLHELLGTFFKAGLVMDALEEPTFTEADQNPKRVESRSNYTQFPALFAFRLRVGSMAKSN